MASAQKPAPKAGMAGISGIKKIDRLIEQFTLGRKKFAIYCGYQNPGWTFNQELGDTLEVYKIAVQGNNYSILEITKLATRQGKIIAEGAYKVINDTLYVYQDSYDYIGAYRLTDTYVSDKYGLKKIADNMEAIRSEAITDRHQKPAEMKTIFPAK